MGLNPASTSPIPPGLELIRIRETISLATAAASFSLTNMLPLGAVVVSAGVYLPLLVTATTAVKVGLGRVTTTADPDKYALSASLVSQEFGGILDLWATPLAAAETVGIFACDTSGAAAGTIGGTDQTAIVEIVYAVRQPISL